MTVLEVIIAASLFLILTTVLLKGFFQGIQAWRQVEERSSLMTTAQKTLKDVSWELESSILDTLEWSNGPGVLSFASPFGIRESASRDQFTVDSASGGLRWNKYVVLYHDTGNRQIGKREWEMPVGSSARTVPTIISAADLGSGLQPLSFYTGGGLTLGQDVESLQLARLGRTLELTLELRNEEGRSGRFVHSVLVRN